MSPRSRFELIDPERTEPISPELVTRREVPRTIHDLKAAAPLFKPGKKLATTINVALSVGAPLLVTGEPGTGKTQLAYYLAWYFGIAGEDQPYALFVKSTSSAGDLLYTFDTVGYFHDGQDPSRKGAPLDKRKYVSQGPLWRAFDDLREGRPAVVLIDEIDKASRDFPNDLLHELDQYAFVVRETGERVERPSDRPPPVVVITSNSERRLPEPFLRRCIFHHIAFDLKLVRRAVAARRDEYGDLDDPTIDAGIAAFMDIRETPHLRKRPATGELMVWLGALNALGVTAGDLEGVRPDELPACTALVKDRDDLLRLAGA